jgi:hypothetical protein
VKFRTCRYVTAPVPDPAGLKIAVSTVQSRPWPLPTQPLARTDAATSRSLSVKLSVFVSDPEGIGPRRTVGPAIYCAAYEPQHENDAPRRYSGGAWKIIVPFLSKRRSDDSAVRLLVPVFTWV